MLFSDGTIRFDYGPGNTGLSPTIGVSAGTGQAYQLTANDGQSALTNANSVMFNLAAGITDIGALEFRGNSTDVAPPTISSTTPAGIATQSNVSGAVMQIGLNFSEALNRIDAVAPANFDLRAAGVDTQFDTGDDIIYAPAIQYVDGSTLVTLNVSATALPGGTYRLTVRSNAADNSGLHDRAGLLLDGDVNASAGGNYVRTFTIAADTIAPTVVGFNFNYNSVSKQSITVQFSEPVLSLDDADLVLTDLANPGTPIPTARVHLESYDANTNTVSFTFTGFPDGTVLPDGNYSADILHTSVSDTAGNPLADVTPLSFFFLNGDANHDRAINALDFNAIATNFGLLSRVFIEGDFNYDGQVNSLDFNVLAQRFNNVLPLPAAIPGEVLFTRDLNAQSLAVAPRAEKPAATPGPHVSLFSNWLIEKHFEADGTPTIDTF